MSACLIVCPQPLKGLPPELVSLFDHAFIIAVDGGLDHLRKAGVTPDLWVGDADSLKSKKALATKAFPKKKLPRSKEYTDLEFALHVAGQRFLAGDWEGDIVLIGAQGGRIDHELGNMMAVQRFLQDLASAVGAHHCPNIYSYGTRGVWIATVDEIDFVQPKGEIFSVLPLGGSPAISISGAKYKARNKVFDHASLGIGNVGLGRTVRVSVAAPTKKKAGNDPVFVVFPAE